MKRKILSSTSSLSSLTANSSIVPQFSRRFSIAGAPPSPSRVRPLGTLWDPTLLDRLQVRLTRYRE